MGSRALRGISESGSASCVSSWRRQSMVHGKSTLNSTEKRGFSGRKLVFQ